MTNTTNPPTVLTNDNYVSKLVTQEDFEKVLEQIAIDEKWENIFLNARDFEYEGIKFLELFKKYTPPEPLPSISLEKYINAIPVLDLEYFRSNYSTNNIFTLIREVFGNNYLEVKDASQCVPCEATVDNLERTIKGKELALHYWHNKENNWFDQKIRPYLNQELKDKPLEELPQDMWYNLYYFMLEDLSFMDQIVKIHKRRNVEFLTKDCNIVSTSLTANLHNFFPHESLYDLTVTERKAKLLNGLDDITISYPSTFYRENNSVLNKQYPFRVSYKSNHLSITGLDINNSTHRSEFSELASNLKQQQHELLPEACLRLELLLRGFFGSPPTVRGIFRSKLNQEFMITEIKNREYVPNPHWVDPYDRVGYMGDSNYYDEFILGSPKLTILGSEIENKSVTELIKETVDELRKHFS